MIAPPVADVDLAVIGGGVVGLSVAYEAARAGRSIVCLEARARLGEEQSTHNSMVIHAGLYYPPDSLKARFCIDGRRELVRRLAAWDVAHRVCGKLVVAADAGQAPAVEALAANAFACGVGTCRVLDFRETTAIEPHARGVLGLHSPETGVLDAGAYVHALAARAQEAGALLLTDAEVVGLDPAGDSIAVATNARGTVRARTVVNAAGLYADRVARLAGNDAYRIYPCRGEYASVVRSKASQVRALVYPVPHSDNRGLGVHATRTVFGELWVGPTARFIESKTDYEADRLPPEAFAEPLARLVGGIGAGDLRLGPSGIRARPAPEGSPAADFRIEADPAAPSLIHLVGIDSPGLTASPAIGRYVAGLAGSLF